jgi:hypothetical protein
MMRVRILGQHRIAPGSTQSFKISPAWRHGRVIVGRAVKLSYGRGAQVGVANVRSRAAGIKGNVGDESNLRVPHLLKSFHARIE